MEEVWKDINLSSLHHYSISTPREDLPNNPSITLPTKRFNDDNNNFRNTAMRLQDFLARPLAIMDPTSTDHHLCCGSSLAPPPVTVLSLKSGGEFHFLDNSGTLEQNGNFNSVLCSSSSTSGLASFEKKKISEPNSSQGDYRDRRHRRMIKNRESAARSRARKQAYTNELELEVAFLQEENERLKRKQAELCRVEATEQPKKLKLFRTSTAPF